MQEVVCREGRRPLFPEHWQKETVSFKPCCFLISQYSSILLLDALFYILPGIIKLNSRQIILGTVVKS